MSMFANNGVGLELGFWLENKDQKNMKGTIKPSMANLDITQWCVYTLVRAFSITEVIYTF